MTEPRWVEARATTHIWDWQVGEIGPVNLADQETQAMIRAGLLIVEDEAVRAEFPAPTGVMQQQGGCGCG